MELFFAFLWAHWVSFTAVFVATPALFVALRSKAYYAFFTLALQLVKQVAKEELEGPEKRKWVVDNGYEALPVWAKQLVTKEKLGEWVEKAYQQLKDEGQV